MPYPQNSLELNKIIDLLAKCPHCQKTFGILLDLQLGIIDTDRAEPVREVIDITQTTQVEGASNSPGQE